MSIEETTTKVATTIINNDVPFISKYLLGLSKNNSKSNNENDNYDVLLQQWTMPFCSNIDIITDGIRSIMQCERDYILSQLPQFYIDRFGVIGSSDSYDNNATNSVDCSGGSGGSRGRNRRRYFQILNPYQIPPGDIRTEWMKEFVVLQKQNRLQDLPFIVFWFKDKVFSEENYTVQASTTFFFQEESPSSTRRRKNLPYIDDFQWIVNEMEHRLKRNQRGDDDDDDWSDDDDVHSNSDSITTKQQQQRWKCPKPGTKVSIYCNNDVMFYDGTVVDNYIPVSTSKIRFDDGHDEWIALSERPFQVLDSAGGTDNGVDRSPGKKLFSTPAILKKKKSKTKAEEADTMNTGTNMMKMKQPKKSGGMNESRKRRTNEIVNTTTNSAKKKRKTKPKETLDSNINTNSLKNDETDTTTGEVPLMMRNEDILLSSRSATSDLRTIMNSSNQSACDDSNRNTVSLSVQLDSSKNLVVTKNGKTKKKKKNKFINVNGCTILSVDRLTSDGCIKPITVERMSDGCYKKPRGKDIKGYRWNEERGLWTPLSETITSKSKATNRLKSKKVVAKAKQGAAAVVSVMMQSETDMSTSTPLRNFRKDSATIQKKKESIIDGISIDHSSRAIVASAKVSDASIFRPDEALKSAPVPTIIDLTLSSSPIEKQVDDVDDRNRVVLQRSTTADLPGGIAKKRTIPSPHTTKLATTAGRPKTTSRNDNCRVISISGDEGMDTIQNNCADASSYAGIQHSSKDRCPTRIASSLESSAVGGPHLSKNVSQQQLCRHQNQDVSVNGWSGVHVSDDDNNDKYDIDVLLNDYI